MVASTELLNRLLDPVGKALSPEVARRILEVRADAATQARVDFLAERANEGVLADDERQEYESLISAANLIAILQSKARLLLRNPG